MIKHSISKGLLLTVITILSSCGEKSPTSESQLEARIRPKKPIKTPGIVRNRGNSEPSDAEKRVRNSAYDAVIRIQNQNPELTVLPDYARADLDEGGFDHNFDPDPKGIRRTEPRYDFGNWNQDGFEAHSLYRRRRTCPPKTGLIAISQGTRTDGAVQGQAKALCYEAAHFELPEGESQAKEVVRHEYRAPNKILNTNSQEFYDWATGAVKLECQQDYFVNGFGVYDFGLGRSDWNFINILCVKGKGFVKAQHGGKKLNPEQNSCETVWFDRRDSQYGAGEWPDFQPYTRKGYCGEEHYVKGIAWKTNQGKYLGFQVPVAMLCCPAE